VPLPTKVQLKEGAVLIVRRAAPKDAAEYIASVRVIAAEREYLMTETFTRTVDEIRAQFRDADPRQALWLVGEIGGRLVGGANFARGRWSKNAHTADLGIALLPAYRGRGIGEALLRAGIDWAQSVGIQKLKLGVFASNKRALALYQKLGFEVEARLKDEVEIDGRRVDEILMARWI
jgi:RimJ/RimL family protein N-acetyltransferase